MPPKALPEINIPFLRPTTHWQVIDASTENWQVRHDPEARQLISWLTLPMAADAITELIVSPMEQAATREGRKITEQPYTPGELEDRITQLQKKTAAGSARPPYMHIVSNPVYLEDDNPMLSVLIPTAQDKRRHVILDLYAKFATVNKRGHAENGTQPTERVSILAKGTISSSKEARQHRLEVPTKSLKMQSEPASNLPVNPDPMAKLFSGARIRRASTE